MLVGRVHDVFIIGGGINGCGVARDAAGRGFSVCLAEMNDLASATSSGSTKLLHGGLRYLERYEFRLVREALEEREVLWSMAPHIIWPLRFVLPHHGGLRPAWLLRLGLFLYDHLGGRRLLPKTQVVELRQATVGKPLKVDYTKAFEYSDLWVDDARLVVLNARDAAARGAKILTRAKVTSAERLDGQWVVTVEQSGGEQKVHRARVLVNAAGPWVDDVIAKCLDRKVSHSVRLVRGSHVIVPRLYKHDRCYIFQNNDKRMLFAIPYETDFTLIGTTDCDYEGNPGEVRISEEETEYICAAASAYFTKRILPTDVRWSYSAVRPLYNRGASSAQEATRDYVLKTEQGEDGAALINIFSGKITTYRKLAESALERVESVLGQRAKPWTQGSSLPGGNFDPKGFDEQLEVLRREFPFLTATHAFRLCRLYGTDARSLIGVAQSESYLGACFGADLFETEVRYLMKQEWARTADDIVWRRTKLGLHLTDEQLSALDQYICSIKLESSECDR